MEAWIFPYAMPMKVELFSYAEFIKFGLFLQARPISLCMHLIKYIENYLCNQKKL
jgi:hypothetical protein